MRARRTLRGLVQQPDPQMNRPDCYTLEAPACAVRNAEPAATSLWVPARLALGTVAVMTVMFSVGQMTGPLLCGAIAAIGLLVLCIALASLQGGPRARGL